MSNKDGTNQKAEFIAMIEAAKSKMHQVYIYSYIAAWYTPSLYMQITEIFFSVQYKVRAYIQMKSSKACKREIKSVMNTAGNVSSNV